MYRDAVAEGTPVERYEFDQLLRSKGKVIKADIEFVQDKNLAEHIVVFDENQIDHQPDNFARREMLAGRLVALLGKPPDQFLEDVAHFVVVHHVGVQIDVEELAQDEEEEVGVIERSARSLEGATLA